MNARDPRAVIESVEPQFLGYRRTLAALRSYRDLRQDDGPPLPNSPQPVEPGMSYPGIQRLRSLLRLVGDLPDTRTPASPNYDRELAVAVQRFQERHGLPPSGLLDPPTLRELNTPIARRVVQLELTLERWRWLHAAARRREHSGIPSASCRRTAPHRLFHERGCRQGVPPRDAAV